MNGKLREEFGDSEGKVSELEDAIGAEVPARSSTRLKEQNLCLGDILDMDSPQPVMLLGVVGSVEQVEQNSRACIEARLQERPKTCGRMDGYHIQSMLLCKLPSCFLCLCLRHRIPFLSKINRLLLLTTIMDKMSMFIVHLLFLRISNYI